ncbi:MAG: acetate--CoA ligase [Planctomycetes bacterium]|nr:acetate--CoA ligase [Planctomycetota bacterium]MCP4771539.1 acetate--CoA ligase [Planctomycetota bacterium]MCP4861200.1 acetate--CoA ligase [Planctomycetota bacterium]
MTDSTAKTIDTLLSEHRTFTPPEEFVAQANVSDPSIYENADADWQGWWASWAEQLQWDQKWDTVLNWNPPYAEWFGGGKLNASVQCLDRHVAAGNGDRVAFYFEGEPGDARALTYSEVLRDVCRIANGLKSLGVEKGDRVAIYMPMVPELAMTLLACSRIGAIFSVVFAGFSPTSLKDRIQDQEAKLVICADACWRRGKILDLKKVVNEAVENCPSVENVVVWRRGGDCVSNAPSSSRDVEWGEVFVKQADECAPVSMDAEDPLFILYTSGTTGKPKGILHTTGGYMTGALATTKLVFDMKPEKDVYWCTADIGWITGHTYIVFGPMANGATQVIYEGAPDFPQQDRFWALIEKYKVSLFYTAPTAIRAFMKWGDEHPAKHDLSSLRLLGSVGEPINPEAWVWYLHHIGGGKCPIVDTWWQTETGSIMITPLPGITTTVPGSATTPFPGVEAKLINEDGSEVVGAGGGYLALTRPWPSMLRGLWRDNKRYEETYWSRFPGKYFAGDGAKRDENDFLWVLGRVDDVMNVSGHRLSTMEIESSLVAHEAVAEAAVVGVAHELKGQAPIGFVILRGGYEASPELEQELRAFVGKEIGGLARPDRITFTPELPKTRSGKIMRRLLRDVAEGKEIGDVTTLADPTVLKGLQAEFVKQG